MWKGDAMASTQRSLVRLLAAAALTLSVAGCSGDGGSSSGSVDEVLSDAAQTLSQTEGVSLDLATKALPSGVAGITRATGVVTSAPAFEGELTVMYGGINANVPLIAVDGTVYAQLPFTPSFDEVDPSEYGAPDPSTLIAADSGFPALLDETSEATKGDEVRGGENNSEVLTTYSGTVPGSAMSAIIPSATGDFDVEWQIADSGELRSAELTGTFYPDSEEMTYTVTFSDYGTSQEIVAP